MTPNFNIRFLIDRLTGQFRLILTDISDYSGTTSHYGFYKIVYPDGVITENTDVENPDFDNNNAVLNIPLRLRKGLIEGTYSITQKTTTDVSDVETEKIFNLSFAEPSLIMSDNSNMVIPSVSFIDSTKYVNPGYNASVTRLIECDFPDTAQVSGTITTASIEIFMLENGNTYEGVYMPKLTTDALFTKSDHEIQWKATKTFVFEIREFIDLAELGMLIAKVKKRLDNSEGNIRQLMDDYFMVTSIYTQIIAEWGSGIESRTLLSINRAKDIAIDEINDQELASLLILQNQESTSIDNIQSQESNSITAIQGQESTSIGNVEAAELAAINAINIIKASIEFIEADINVIYADIQLLQSQTLGYKNDAESAATTSTQQAILSAAARDAAEGHKIGAQQAEGAAIVAKNEAEGFKDDAEAAQTAAETARDAILDKAEVNVTTAGNILRADGSIFKSEDERVSFARLRPYERAPLGFFFQPKSIIAWDNFDRPDENPVTVNDSGQAYQQFKGISLGRVGSKVHRNISLIFESVSMIEVEPTQFIGVQLNVRRATFGDASGLIVAKDDNNFIFFGRSSASGVLGGVIPQSGDWVLWVVINDVATSLGQIANTSIFGGGNDNGFEGNVIRWIIRYGNRGRNDASRILVYPLENPSLRIEVDMTTYNSTFQTPDDYKKIGLFNRASTQAISCYCVANLRL
jgi:hypothetical protein